MTKTVASFTAFALVMGVSAVAAAQVQPTCPPGSWFCADAQVPGLGGAQITVGGGGPTQLQPLPAPQQPVQIQVQPPPPIVVQQAPQQPPVVVYQPAPPPVVIMRPPMQPDYRTYYVRRPVQLPQQEWGLNLRVEGAFIGSGYAGNAGLGGFGAGLRYKPSPWFGIEAGADFVIGRDYNNYARNETGLSLSGLLFLNPRSRAQVYLLGGFGWSIANVTNDSNSQFGPLAAQENASYHYFGGQAGIGIEYRLSRNLAVNVDMRGFLRGRTDGNNSAPEFTDPKTGNTTNTSGGLLFTGGMTFYF